MAHYIVCVALTPIFNKATALLTFAANSTCQTIAGKVVASRQVGQLTHGEKFGAL
jgi:hypothetical protein